MKNITMLLVGCGGTGSWIANNALQSLALSSDQHGHSVQAVFIDADTVEFKNTLRQAFTLGDIGTNKALALAERYGKNYDGLEDFKLSIIQKFILDDPDRTEHLDRFVDFDLATEFTSEDSLCVVVSVIDNNKTRKAIHRSFEARSGYPHLILDAGNEDTYGQVTVTSYYPEYAENRRTYWELHPEMLEFNDGVKAGPSCAEHDEAEANAGVVQTMSANMISAAITCGYLDKIFNFDFSSLENETRFIINSKNYSLNYVN